MGRQKATGPVKFKPKPKPVGPDHVLHVILRIQTGDGSSPDSIETHKFDCYGTQADGPFVKYFTQKDPKGKEGQEFIAVRKFNVNRILEESIVREEIERPLVEVVSDDGIITP